MGADWNARSTGDLIARIYRAPTDPPEWREVLRIIAEGLGASVAAVHIHSPDGGTATSVGIYGEPTPGALAKYQSYYAARNVWLNHGAHLIATGAVLTGDEMCSDEILLRSEFYNDFLRPLAVKHSIRAVLGSSPEPLAYLSGARPVGRRPFGARERRRLAELTPHLIHAMRLQARLESVECHRRATSDAMDRLPLGVFLLDARGRVVEMNATARKIVGERDGLALDRGALLALDTRADVQLQRMIFGASAAGSGRNLTLGGACALPRADGGHPLSAMVAPTGITGIFPSSRAASVVVLVEEPVRRPAVPLEGFSRGFGLSRAESSLTARLVSGLSLQDAADALGIRKNTARSHLKHVFAKTGAKRQSDLVRRVLTHESGAERATSRRRPSDA